MAVIDVCGALADAQAEYFSQPRDDRRTKQYALKFISDAGRQNGLYWESPADQPRSPLGPLVAFATPEGYNVKPNSHTPFHGYYFQMLNRQGTHAPGGARDYVVNGKMIGGFAFVAYPAEYGNSGVMTFIINQDGVLLQKDLGKTTTRNSKRNDCVRARCRVDPSSGIRFPRTYPLASERFGVLDQAFRSACTYSGFSGSRRRSSRWRRRAPRRSRARRARSPLPIRRRSCRLPAG